MINKLRKFIEEHGTPLFALDHKRIRENYRIFKKNLPRVQCYYAVKANAEPAIVRTFYCGGGEMKKLIQRSSLTLKSL